MVGKLFKRFLLRPKVRKMTWQQLLSGAAATRQRLLDLISSDTEATASVNVIGEMSIKETIAHLAVANRSIAGRLDSLRNGEPANGALPELFPGAEGKSLADVRQEYDGAWKQLVESAARPIVSEQTINHEFFGPIDAKEWLGVVAYHHEYHIRKIERVKGSKEYREAQGATW